MSSDCQHEWADITREVRNQRVFLCGKCKLQKLVGAFSDLVIQAERQLGVPELTWSTEKPTEPGWYWYRKDPADAPILLYCGTVWDHVVDFADLNEPVAFTKDHLLEGEWAGPVEPPLSGQSR